MKKSEIYRQELLSRQEWDKYLLQESGLPGPRGNIELAQVVADLGDEGLFRRFLTYDATKAPVNSPFEFLSFCGVVGLGRLVAEGQNEHFKSLRLYASDPRWRMREGVAMALQRVGDANMELLLREMGKWSKGNPLEMRAAAAALCEPRLLKKNEHALGVLEILDVITGSIPQIQDRKTEAFDALRKGLGYCWSVAVAALPGDGKKSMEKWFSANDPDINWIMRENLKKNRLVRVDAAWVAKWQTRLAKKPKR
jgi:hypothetical protein